MRKPRTPPAVVDKNLSNNSEPKQCCWVDCELEGTYRAPKSPHQLQAYYWFCLEHVRLYNASWDYFSSMSEEEIENYQRDALLGHRPTWKIHSSAHIERDVLKKVQGFFHTSKKEQEIPEIPAKEREALSLLDLHYPVTVQQVKIRYKALVKKYHPDINKDDPKAEEMFKKISSAYRTLVNSSFIRKQ